MTLTELIAALQVALPEDTFDAPEVVVDTATGFAPIDKVRFDLIGDVVVITTAEAFNEEELE